MLPSVNRQRPEKPKQIVLVSTDDELIAFMRPPMSLSIFNNVLRLMLENTSSEPRLTTRGAADMQVLTSLAYPKALEDRAEESGSSLQTFVGEYALIAVSINRDLVLAPRLQAELDSRQPNA
jgi:hypothetical protein